MTVGDDANYVSLSAGADDTGAYFYYEAVVDGNVVTNQESRTTDDGTLYVSYNADSNEFYLSRTGFGSGDAYMTVGGKWSMPVDVTIGGGSSGATLDVGEANLDYFEIAKAVLLGWPPSATDIDGNGYIDIYDLAMLCDNWLLAEPYAGDINDDGSVDFYDYVDFCSGW